MAKKVACDVVYTKNMDELNDFEKLSAITTVFQEPSLLNRLEIKQYE